MRVAVVGSRDWQDAAAVRHAVMGLLECDVLVSGGAVGVDTIAAACARARGLKVEVHLPDYDRLGKVMVPLRRNALIAQRCDRMIAFWSGSQKSTGTLHAVREAKRLGKPVEMHRAGDIG